MHIKKTYGIPCEHDNCLSKDTYYINISNGSNWLCEQHMEKLIENIQEEFNKIKNKQEV